MDHIAHDDDADRLRASRGVGGDDGRSDDSELRRGGGAPGDDDDRDARSSRRRRAAISAVLVVLSAAAVALGASVLAASGEARREQRHPIAAAAALGDGGTDPTSPKPATNGRFGNVVCVDEGSCDAARKDLGVPYYYRGDFSPYYGCMVKDDIAFFGRGGKGEKLATPSDGEYVRIWCGTQSSPKDDDGSVDLPDYLQDNC